MKLNRCLLALAVLVAAGPLASVLPSQAQAVPALEAGIAAENITPFTVTGSGQTIDPASDPAASNPDGTQGGLWDTFHPLASVAPGQVTPSGVWGEKFTDSNANNRWDDGEDFVDDPLNTRLDPLSAGKYDGAFLAGFGNDRVAKGAFDPIWARSMYVRDPATGTSFVQVSLDLIGWFSAANDRIRKLVDEQWAAAWEREHPGVPAPPLDLDHMVVSHTHNHEAPDVHVGLWGAEVKTPAANLPLRDGTFPRYERYIELKIAQSIA
ncbi:MAG TPA: hypothetical protein VNE62_06830, partial [Actinomycetota bacterium]|nr:hypothetical protein [Actinomycetota bacterium]